MNILNNGRFGMAAALSGTMKKLIEKAVRLSIHCLCIYTITCVSLCTGGPCFHKSAVWEQVGNIRASAGENRQNGTASVRHRGMSYTTAVFWLIFAVL